MGEVYRADDTKLGREVAIKVLPEAVAEDSERLARFEREAKVLASLNHPNIAAIYALEAGDRILSPDQDQGESILSPSSSVHFLVMELVEGEDLKERLERGPIPFAVAQPIVLQVAAALEAAHQKGIIHRDLKPANIKVTPDGQVKILDFGLAKALDPSAGSDPDRLSVSLSPTLTAQMTQAGVLLGTAAYMAPEQARGQEVDRQADIWAFGAVLFEMLSGRIAFPGATVTDVIAAVVSQEPDWGALPTETPPNVTELLKLCLNKDARERIHDIGDARLLLTRPAAPSEKMQAPETRRSSLLSWIVAGVLAVLVVVLALWPRSSDESSSARPVQRFSINLPAEVNLEANEPIALSPDGSSLAFVGWEGGERKLFLRRLDSNGLEVLSEGELPHNPFFSPDGSSIVFSSDRQAKLLGVSLGSSRVWTIADGDWGGGSWGPDDTIVYTPTYTDGLHRVSASGGKGEELTRPDLEKGELGHFWPQHLPGGKQVLFTVFSVPLSRSTINVLDLESGESGVVIDDAVWGRYLPTSHLVFVRDQTLMGVRLDLETMEVRGAPIELVADVIPDIGQGDPPVALASNGTLAYVPGAVAKPPRQLTWVQRDGKETPVAEPRRYGDPRISPDGKRISLTIADKTWDLWALELDRGTLSRLSSEPATQFGARWMPDGEQILYSQDDPPYNLYRRRADGSGEPEPLVQTAVDNEAYSVSPDGEVLLYSHSQTSSNYDIWMLSLVGDRAAEPWLATPFTERFARFSPDGRWVLYTSNETGEHQVYLNRFPEGGRKIQVSLSGGTRPLWSRDGREIFFRNGPSMMAVDVTKGDPLSVGRPRELFRGAYQTTNNKWGYDVAEDGRFIMIKAPDEDRPREISVVLNWFQELEELVPNR